MIAVSGIDLSLTTTGWANFRDGEEFGGRYIKTGRVLSSSQGADATTFNRDQRLTSIAARLVRDVTQDLPPRESIPLEDAPIFVIESPLYAPNSTGSQHDRSGLWWLVVHALMKQGIVVEVAPTTLKRYITGKGGGPDSGKDAMIAHINRLYGEFITDNNVADALGLAAMGAREIGHPIELSTQRVTPAALEAVKWPSTIVARRP